KSTGQLQDLLEQGGFKGQASKLAQLPRGTAITAPEAVAAIQETGLYGSRAGTLAQAMIEDAGKTSGVNPLQLVEGMEKASGGGVNGVKNIGELQQFIEADQRAVGTMNEATATASRSDKLVDALGPKAGTQEGQELLRTASRWNVKTVGDLRDLAQNRQIMGFDQMFPKLGQMRAANLINPNTTLAEASQMGSDVFAGGKGLGQMLGAVPEDM